MGITTNDSKKQYQALIAAALFYLKKETNDEKIFRFLFVNDPQTI